MVGEKYEHILTGLLSYGNIDKAYLLHSERTADVAKRVKETMRDFKIDDVYLKSIDIFSVDDMVNSIGNIAKSEGGNNLFINITGGTNLMAGAACATSYFIGAQAYYIKDKRRMPPGTPMKELLIELPIPNIGYNNMIEEKQLKILNLISKRKGPSSNKLLRQDGILMSPQLLSYHLGELTDKRLITMSTSQSDSRIKYYELTNVGKLVLAWSKTKLE